MVELAEEPTTVEVGQKSSRFLNQGGHWQSKKVLDGWLDDAIEEVAKREREVE